MSILYKNEEEKKAIINFLNLCLIDFLKWIEKNEFNLNDYTLTLVDLDKFTQKWIEKQSNFMKEMLDKSEERQNELWRRKKIRLARIELDKEKLELEKEFIILAHKKSELMKEFNENLSEMKEAFKILEKFSENISENENEL